MANLSFNDGYKEYTINGDESKVIRIRTADMQILSRISNAQKVIKDMADKMSKMHIPENATDEEKISIAAESLAQADKAVREQVDYIVGSHVADIAFGNANCMSLTDNGNPIYANFLEALVPVIKSDVEAAAKKSQKNITKYTQAYKK